MLGFVGFAGYCWLLCGCLLFVWMLFFVLFVLVILLMVGFEMCLGVIYLLI